MKLLLHACCGPCSLEPVRLLQEAGHNLTIYYANSNIAPADEYAHRLTTLRAWAESAGVSVLEGAYAPEAWEATVGRIGDAALAEAEAARVADADPTALPLPLAIDPQKREARCRACYRMRLEETANIATEQGFEGIGTTLAVSPYQYTQIIGKELEHAAQNRGIGFLFEDYRPFYDEATRRSRELGMYRQNYCGCRFSADEAEAERAIRKRERAAAKAAEAKAHAAERAAEEAARAANRAEKQAYAAKQAKKRAVLKALREKNANT